ncbi:MAG TPA: hypothetical protein VMS76_12930 [Planctomycetota bacterium]|nr:hypothetical protein [Planctomycetota bacterium]
MAIPPAWLCALLIQGPSGAPGTSEAGASAVEVPPAPAPEDPAPPVRRVGPFDVVGEVTAGWRTVGVNGNRAQFEEDQEIATGPLLRDLHLGAERAEGAGFLERMLLDARGLGDPFSSARAELEGSGLKASGRWTRSEFVANADSELHPFDFTREAATLRLEPQARGPAHLHGGLELSWHRRDGFVLGTRSVDFGFVSGVATRREDRSLGARGDLGLELAGWDLHLDAGIEGREGEERRKFRQPSPSSPSSVQTEDFRADLDGHVAGGSARASRSLLEGRLRLDLGVSAARGRHDGDLDSFETGILFDPSSPFTRLTQGDADLDSRALVLEAGARYELDEETELFGRISRTREDEHADLSRHIVLDESGSISVLDIDDRTRHEGRLDLFEVGLARSLSAWADLSVTVQAGREEVSVLETSQGSLLRRFDGDLEPVGAQAALELAPARDWQVTVSGGHDVWDTENTSPGTQFDFERERQSFGSLRVRWRASSALSLFATGRVQHRESDAFASESLWSLVSLGASGVPAEGWTAQGSLALRDFDAESETTMVFLHPGPVQVPTTVTFRGTQAVLSGSSSWAATARFEPRLGFSAAAGRGDGAFRFGALLLDLPYRIAPATWVGSELQLTDFDGRDTFNDSDYRAAVALLYLRTSL